MSTLASGYIVKNSDLSQLTQLVLQKRFDEFWVTMRAHEAAPTWSESGYLLAVAITCLQTKGIRLPLLDNPSCHALVTAKDLGIVSCAEDVDCKHVVAGLESLQISKEEAGQYFEDFTGEAWPGGGQAILDAVTYLKNLFSVILKPGELLVLSIC